MIGKLNEYDIQFLIERLQKGDPIPEDYKYKLFPVKQKEYLRSKGVVVRL